MWNTRVAQSVVNKWEQKYVYFVLVKDNISIYSTWSYNFCLALPGCNTPVKQIFSKINIFWGDKKNRLKIRQ